MGGTTGAEWIGVLVTVEKPEKLGLYSPGGKRTY